MIAKGQHINDRYEIDRLIGEGGMANVYLAHDTILDRKVAVKVLRGDLAGDDKFVRRFQREALNASSLSHPNIVEIYDVDEEDGNFFIVMEYIEGKTLKQLIRRRGVLTLPETIDIMLQLMDALAVAHDSYIIHRDIKPQNIMIKESGLVKITDFGIAMALNSVELTQTNSVMGSVHYLPPEQASGKGSTIRSDIYSLGIMMYEMLAGKVPFKGDSAVEIALKHIKEPLPSIRKINSVVPQSVENIILKATAKNPKNRYRDVRQMAEDIKTCMDEDRMDEEKIVFKYPEYDFSETTKAIKVTKEKKEKKNEEVVAKKIEDNNEEENKNNKKMAIIIGILVAFVIGLFIMFFVVPKYRDSQTIEIPDVYGMNVSSAEKLLKKNGFKVNRKKKSSDTIEEGLVIETEPSKNSSAKKGSVIVIYYSTGLKSIDVVNYKGKTYIEVRDELEAYGINVEIEKKEVSDATNYVGKEEIILEQSVKPGNSLKKGDSIVLYIPKLVYPDFVGEHWDLESVKEFCDKLGISYKIVSYQDNAELDADIVLAVNINAGEEIDENDTLKIVLSKKPEITTSAPTEEEETN